MRNNCYDHEIISKLNGVSMSIRDTSLLKYGRVNEWIGPSVPSCNTASAERTGLFRGTHRSPKPPAQPSCVLGCLKSVFFNHSIIVFSERFGWMLAFYARSQVSWVLVVLDWLRTGTGSIMFLPGAMVPWFLQTKSPREAARLVFEYSQASRAKLKLT